MDRAAAIKSAIGAEYMTPSIPIIRGRIISSGSRKIICRVRDRKMPRTGLPIEVKKLAASGCRKLTKVKNR